MMILYKKIAILLSVLLLFAGCARSTLLNDGVDPQSPDHRITLSIESYTDNSLESATRSSDLINQYTIHYGYIFFFNSKGEYVSNYFVDKDVDDIVNNGGKDISFLIDDASYSNSYKIVCVFNFDKDNFSDDFSKLTYENFFQNFPMDKDFLSSVEKSHNGLQDYLDDGGVRYDVGMPMFVNDFTNSSTGAHKIYRAIARLSVAMQSGLSIPHESHSHEIDPADITFALVNQQTSGAIGNENVAKENAEGAIYDGVSTLLYNYPVNLYEENQDHSANPKTYLYDFPYSTAAVDGSVLQDSIYTKKRLALILAHYDRYTSTTLYYKMNLVDKIVNNFFDVKYNHDYRIVIKSVYSRGYESLEEAYLMPPSNIEYEIYDDMGDFTYSNGQYAISMNEILSYDNVQIFGHSSMDLVFDNIRYVIPDDMSSVDVNDLTNSVEFEILSTDGLEVETLVNDFETEKKLTPQGRSIVLRVTGEGSCTFKLLIKLGNLELGRESISVIKNADDGALDAHPIQIEYKGIEILPETWSSDDLDFGAWYDQQANRSIVYMGDNAIPTGYKTMDGYVSSSNAKDSYPIFSEKVRTAYYSYIDHSEEHPHEQKTKIMALQLPPAYLGHFGARSAEGAHTQYNAIVAERIEEIELRESWAPYNLVSKTDGVIEWATTTDTYYIAAQIFSDNRYINGVNGREITKYLAETYWGNDAMAPKAATYCYLKNDVNGNGILEEDEPIEWYLPATNQALAMWINHTALEVDPRYDLNGGEGDSNPYYWTCSEYDSWNTQSPGSGGFQSVMAINILEGMPDAREKANIYAGAHIRCVRAVNH